MRKYSVNSVTLSTGSVYSFVENEDGRAVTGYSSSTNCEKLAELLNDRGIQTLQDWQALERKIRVAFIATFCETSPNL